MLQFGFFGDLIVEVTYFGMDFIFKSTEFMKYLVENHIFHSRNIVKT